MELCREVMLPSRCFHPLPQIESNFPNMLPLLKSWCVRSISSGRIWWLSFRWTPVLPVTFFLEMLYVEKLSKLSWILVYREQSACSALSRPAVCGCFQGIMQRAVEFGRTFWDSPLHVLLKTLHFYQPKIWKNRSALWRIRLFSYTRNFCLEARIQRKYCSFSMSLNINTWCERPVIKNA